MSPTETFFHLVSVQFGYISRFKTFIKIYDLLEKPNSGIVENIIIPRVVLLFILWSDFFRYLDLF